MGRKSSNMSALVDAAILIAEAGYGGGKALSKKVRGKKPKSSKVVPAEELRAMTAVEEKYVHCAREMFSNTKAPYEQLRPAVYKALVDGVERNNRKAAVALYNVLQHSAAASTP